MCTPNPPHIIRSNISTQRCRLRWYRVAGQLSTWLRFDSAQYRLVPFLSLFWCPRHVPPPLSSRVVLSHPLPHHLVLFTCWCCFPAGGACGELCLCRFSSAPNICISYTLYLNVYLTPHRKLRPLKAYEDRSQRALLL